MIRPVRTEDIPAIVAMVQQDRTMSHEELAERVTENNAVVLDDFGVRGIAVWDDKTVTPRGGRTNIWMFTALPYRNRGVASQLWERVWPEVCKQNPELVVTGYRGDKGNSSAFFKKRGFTYWFSSHVMSYIGQKFNAPMTLTPVPYEGDHFWHYIKLNNEGFLGLRQDNDIVPHECYPPGFDELKTRNRLLEDKNNIYLFCDENGTVVGLAHVDKDSIDTITIAKEHMRKGYGRQITMFCVDLLLDRGCDRVALGVVDTNRGARKLYESLGFERVETVEIARRMSSAK